MKEEVFRQALIKKGKKESVVDTLIESVRLFEIFLQTSRGISVDEAVEDDLSDYTTQCEAEKSGSAKIKIRGVLLYYDFTGNKPLALLAKEIRERGTVIQRKSFKIKDFLWVNDDHVTRLEKLGISDVDTLVKATKKPDDRANLANETGIEEDGILELVKLADLARLSGIKGVRARLYHDAGADTWEKIAGYDPQQFISMLKIFIEKTQFPGIPPTPKEATYTINAAKTMPKVIEW